MIESRTSTLVKDYECICKSDPAVDKTVDDFDNKWSQYTLGKAECPLRAGAKPTIFTLGHIMGKPRGLLEKETSYHHVEGKSQVSVGSAIAAFKIAFRSVENFQVDGKEFIPKFTVENGVKLLSNESTLHFPDHIVVEVGARAQSRTYLDPK